jgi:hypothetical protein
VQCLGSLDTGGGLVGEQRGNLERHPAVDTVSAFVDGEEEVGRSLQILDRQVEEQFFAGPALRGSGPDGVVVVA